VERGRGVYVKRKGGRSKDKKYVGGKQSEVEKKNGEIS
jgi:hypothetical protein